MANLLSLERGELAYGTTRVLDAVSLGVGTGERIGVVGRNGSGKTSLLRVLAGAQPLDAGRLARGTGVRVGVLSQQDDLDPLASIGDIVHAGMPAHEWASRPRVREIMAGLLGDVDASAVGGLDKPAGKLSGGERRRVALARLLVDDPDVLLLDEPTNHVDMPGIAWLADWLAGCGRAVVAVTHDRWFLDAMANLTWEVHDGTVESYEGGYAAYVLARAERDRLAATAAQRRDNLLRKELAWLRRGAPARTSKPKFRIEAAEALIADEPPPRDSAQLVRFAAARLGSRVIDLLDVAVPPVLSPFTWRIAPGERVGVLGANGTGKTTLLRTIAGEIPLAQGRRRVGPTVRLAMLSQSLTELDAIADSRVIEAIEGVRRVVRLGDREVAASSLAMRLGFDHARQQALVGDLSGGERRRLHILRLLMDEPNVLLLDEPTNDLDTDMLASLEDVLDGWSGTLIVVSHDRYLLERVTDRQLGLLGDGLLRDLPGGVEQYLALHREQATSGARGRPEPAAAESAGRSAASHAARKTMARVERRLARIEAEEARLHAVMVQDATDHARLRAHQAELAALAAERASLEQEWFEAAEIG